MRFSTKRLVASLLACVLALGASAAAAQLRSIPADAKRGTLTPLQENVVRLDDHTMRLAPGALIRDADNLIVLPLMVPAASPVRYQLDSQGLLHRVWLLSPREAAQKTMDLGPSEDGTP